MEEDDDDCDVDEGVELDAQTRIAQLFFIFGNGIGRGGTEENGMPRKQNFCSRH